MMVLTLVTKICLMLSKLITSNAYLCCNDLCLICGCEILLCWIPVVKQILAQEESVEVLEELYKNVHTNLKFS